MRNMREQVGQLTKIIWPTKSLQFLTREILKFISFISWLIIGNYVAKEKIFDNNLKYFLHNTCLWFYLAPQNMAQRFCWAIVLFFAGFYRLMINTCILFSNLKYKFSQQNLLSNIYWKMCRTSVNLEHL